MHKLKEWGMKRSRRIKLVLMMIMMTIMMMKKKKKNYGDDDDDGDAAAAAADDDDLLNASQCDSNTHTCTGKEQHERNA